jgi:hypothetical protein
VPRCWLDFGAEGARDFDIGGLDGS